jgi:hypothetical protein
MTFHSSEKTPQEELQVPKILSRLHFWRVLQKCWLGFKITKGQDDVKKMKYYSEGIRKAQEELGLEVDSFPNLGSYGTDASDR